MDFDLRQLRHARALAEEGSFARAARAQHLTQPALSRSIQELERRTGIKLFDRAKGRVELTDLGQIFLAHARQLLGHAEALDREVAGLRGTGTGSLVIGSGTFPTALYMADALSVFLKRNPRVGIRLVNDNWVALVSALRRREVDFIVAAQPSPDETADLSIQPLSTRQGYFLVRSGHPLASRRDLTLADVVAHPIVGTARLAPAGSALLLAARRDRDAQRRIPDVACESHEMMRHIASTTDHVLISSLALNARAIDEGRLALLPIVEPRMQVTFAVIRLQGRTLRPIADELIGDVVAADRAGAAAERDVAARLLGPEARRAKGSAKRARDAQPLAGR
jgi:DNA-binding transcriptional LysR family regulator